MKLPGFVNPNAFMPVRWFYPELIWRIPSKEKIIYLTFDDGPVGDVTLWVLEQLKSFQAKATFFCVGENVEKHPEIFNEIKSQGHTVGNHTHHHLNGWKTKNKIYLENIEQADQLIQSSLFRPPYGRIKKSQIKNLLKESRQSAVSSQQFAPYQAPVFSHLPSAPFTSSISFPFKIIMWDVLSFDFDKNISGEKCFQNIIRHAKPGSIIVMHDSLKAKKNLVYTLPKVLNYYSEKGFRFEQISG